jgi:hypothetical protein
MTNEDLRHLLHQGFDEHVTLLGSGAAFTADYQARVTRGARRRRIVRAGAMIAGAAASLAVVTVGAQAVTRTWSDNEPGEQQASPSFSPSFPSSPSESPTDRAWPDWAINGTYVPPVPTGPPHGIVLDDDVLRVLPSASAPAPANESVSDIACGDPVAGPFADPILGQVSARILRPDTVYPTFADPNYVAQPGDVLEGISAWFRTADGAVDPSLARPVGAFWVAVSYRSEALSRARIYDPVSEAFSGGTEVAYNVVARQGVVEDLDFDSQNTGMVHLALGAVIVDHGEIIGHGDLMSEAQADADMFGGTFLSTINEVSATDGNVDLVYDFGAGPLEHIVWCGDQPAGPVDAYAVIGVRALDEQVLRYSFVWAGSVEYQ